MIVQPQPVIEYAQVVQPQIYQPGMVVPGYAQAVPQAVVGLDTNHDGRANLFVSGADRNFDGIPDVLQQPQVVYGNAVPGAVQYFPGQFNAIPVQEAQAVPNGGVL